MSNLMSRRNFLAGRASDRTRPQYSLGPEYYTNAVLRTHENKPVRFYDDLIKGKLVMINFMYANCQGICPRATANLVKVQRALNGRVGKDIFMYSISLKPEEDTPEVLGEYARVHGVKPGWLFLTGSEYDITTIRFKLFRWNHPAVDFDLDRHTGMARILNDSLNHWGMYPTIALAEQIVEAIKWAEPTPSLEVRLRENRLAQAKIDEEARAARLAAPTHQG
jgi:protein SCO1/2